MENDVEKVISYTFRSGNILVAYISKNLLFLQDHPNSLNFSRLLWNYRIVTTHANLIRVAKNHDLLAIQRVFILDNASYCARTNNANPDSVEILLGISVLHIFDNISKISQAIIAVELINAINHILNSVMKEFQVAS